MRLNVRLVLACPCRRARVLRLIQRSVFWLGSDFTGMNCTEDCLLAHLSCAAEELGVVLRYEHTRSCDCDELSRSVLLSREIDPPSVIFGNFFDRIAEKFPTQLEPGPDDTAEEAAEVVVSSVASCCEY